jgi:hypothetical protein
VHPCFDAHPVVAIVLEAMAAAEDYALPHGKDNDDDATDDALC